MRRLLTFFLITLFVSNIITLQIQQIKQNQTGTRVVFYVQHEVQQPTDFVQISIQIKSKQPSLDHAITQAKEIVDKVQNIVKNYCLQYAKSKSECEDVVETSQYEINPIYQLVRKVPTFVAFSVKHQTVARINDVRNIGKLADDILKSKVTRINSFQWKPLQQIDIQEQAVTEGMQLLNNICSKMNMEINHILYVSEVSDYDEQQEKQEEKDKNQEDQEEEEQEEQEEEQKNNKVVYRFEIICGPKKNTKTKN